MVAKGPVNNAKELVYNFPKEADNFDLSNQAGMKNALMYLLKTTEEQKSEILSLKN